MTIQEMMTQNNLTEEGLYEKLANQIYEQLMRNTSKKCVNFTLHPGESDVLSSKIGGVPFIPQGGEYPVNANDGSKLHLLIQLNFAQMPHMEPYPKSGILQIFIDSKDCYGINWDDPQCQDSWRILYHEDISSPMPLESVKGLMPAITKDAELPFEESGQSFTLEFEETEMPLTVDDFHFGINQEMEELLPEELKGLDYYDLPEEFIEKIEELLVGGDSHLGGYPGFTQDDPREGTEVEDYELLLQIDSVHKDGKWYLLWGDCGIANFFIHPDDLKKRDFSRVYYNWDCC